MRVFLNFVRRQQQVFRAVRISQRGMCNILSPEKCDILHHQIEHVHARDIDLVARGKLVC